MSAAPKARKRGGGATFLLLITVIAAPLAFALESALRALLFPPEFEDMRWYLRPTVSVVAWVLFGVALITSAAGQRMLVRTIDRRLAALGEGASEDKRQQAVVGTFLLTSSLPQIPAILATLASMFGSELLPVALAVAVASLGVLVQALRARSALRPR
jgi:membrane protein YqaA with SNARE-associated domain